MAMNVETIKRKFAEHFPEAAEAIKIGTAHERIPALAMYEAYKQGYICALGERQ